MSDSISSTYIEKSMEVHPIGDSLLVNLFFSSSHSHPPLDYLSPLFKKEGS